MKIKNTHPLPTNNPIYHSGPVYKHGVFATRIIHHQLQLEEGMKIKLKSQLLRNEN